MLRFKVNVMPLLKEAGYSSTRLRAMGKDGFGEYTMSKFRNMRICSMNELARLCEFLDCQPGELIEYVKETSEK